MSILKRVGVFSRLIPYIFLLAMVAELVHRFAWIAFPQKSPYHAGITEYEHMSICGFAIPNPALSWKLLWVFTAAFALVLFARSIRYAHTPRVSQYFTKRRAVAALVLMIAVVLAIQIYFCYNLRVLLGDEDEYPKMAYHLATSGDFFITWTGRSWFYPLIAGTFHWFYMNLFGNTVCYETEYLSISPQNWSCAIVGVRLLNTFLTLLSIALTFCLASELYDTDVGVLSSFLVSTNWNFLYWGVRSVSDISPTPFVLASLLLIFKGWKPRSKKQFALSGFLIGVATMCRFSSAVFFATTLLLILMIRAKDLASPYVAGFSAAMVVQALLDYAVYGIPFKSPWRFLTFNLNTDQVLLIQYPTPPEFYLYCLCAIFGPALYLALLSLMRREWKMWFVAANAFALVLAHSIFIHKEARYVLSATPLLAILIAYSALEPASRSERVARALLVLVYVVYSVLQLAWIACNNPYFWY